MQFYHFFAIIGEKKSVRCSFSHFRHETPPTLPFMTACVTLGLLRLMVHRPPQGSREGRTRDHELSFRSRLVGDEIKLDVEVAAAGGLYFDGVVNSM